MNCKPSIFTILLAFSFAVHCKEKKSSEEEALALLLLLNSESSQVSSGSNQGCPIREDAIVLTSGDEVRVNASSSRCWMLVRLRGGTATQIAPGSDDWDIRLRRFVIGTNSGTSGGGSGGACDTGLTDFAGVNSGNLGNCANSANFQVDSIQTQQGAGFGDVNDSANPVLFNWYSYTIGVLTAKDNVYILRGKDGSSLLKFQMRGYYSQAGTSGYPTFRWAPL